jgi:phosphatidylinositol 4-kinase type 2
VLVWDEEIEVDGLDGANDEDGPSSPTMSISSVPLPRRSRSQSYGEFPPPMRRTSTDASGAPRPVPFAAKFQRIHPGTTGVTVLEHLERLDAVEASLQRLGVDEEEVDIGVSSAPPAPSRRPHNTHSRQGSSSAQVLFSPPLSPRLEPVPEASRSPSASASDGPDSRRSSLDEEDLVAMSKSTSHVEGGYPFSRNIGTITTAGLDWTEDGGGQQKRVMITEVSALSFPFGTCSQELMLILRQRLETVKKAPLCSCW